MKEIKNLYIILSKDGIDYIIKNLQLDCKNCNELISFAPIDSYKDILNEIFSVIYDFSKSKDKEIVDFYFDKVLNLVFKKEDAIEGDYVFNEYETKPNYDSIYFYDKQLIKCNMEIKKDTNYAILQNAYYGMDTILKKYSNYEGIVYPFIEHSPLWNGQFSHHELETICPSIIAFSDYRYNLIINSQKTKKDIIRIGPYIHYANTMYSSEFINHIKLKMGKTLLVFPAHSIKTSILEYNEEEFANYIEKFALEKDFQTVLICMFHQDIVLQRDKFFKDKGFRIVSCGHKYDVNFFYKLKCLIKMSDYTMSNIFATHVGYCIYMNKPHHIFMQDVKSNMLKPNNESIKKVKVKKYDLGEVFKFTEDNINKEQYELCNEYWGFEHVKTPEEIKFILEFYSDIFEKCKNIIEKDMDMKDIENIFNKFISLKLLSEPNEYNEIISASR